MSGGVECGAIVRAMCDKQLHRRITRRERPRGACPAYQQQQHRDDQSHATIIKYTNRSQNVCLQS